MPNRYWIVSHGFQFSLDFDIAPLVVCELVEPEFPVGFWSRCLLTSFVSMPITTVNEYRCVVRTDPYVGSTRFVLDIGLEFDIQ